jgi:GTPase SAR1 family protein
MNEHGAAGSPPDRPETEESTKIVVVGPCAAGKSTLVEALQARGYDAHASGQEHSAIASLWQHSHPDVLIALEVDISAVWARRGNDWPEWLHDLQVQRLREAAEAADLAIDTTDLDPVGVVDRVLAYLSSRATG